MKNSELLKDILKEAERIRSDANFQYISAPCVLISIYELCRKEYTGITPYDKCLYPEFYEEERLRYLFEKFLKGRGSTVMNILKKQLGDKYLQYDTDFLSKYTADFEAITKSRKKLYLSADIVFMYAIKDFEPIHHLLLHPEYIDSVSVRDIFSEIDKNVYDFIIDKIEKVQIKLQCKADEARKKRDWRPAEKFTEPQDLLNEIYKSVSFSQNKNSIELTFSNFFGNSSEELKLTVCRKNSIYYVHDNGCAHSVLKKNVGEKYEEFINKYFSSMETHNEKIFGKFIEIKSFLMYLQKLIFVANADLVCEHINSYKHFLDYSDDPNLSVFDEIDAEAFVNNLKQSLHSLYDENKGLILGIDMTYYPNSTSVTYLIETLGNSIRIKDNSAKNVEGSVFENLYWGNNDILSYSDFISPFIKRFGGDFDGKDISITAEITNGKIVPVLFRFINLAILLSQLSNMNCK